MKRKVKFLITGLFYLNHNYGAQGIAFPIMEKLSSKFDAEYTFVLAQKGENQALFSKKYTFNVIDEPHIFAILRKRCFPLYLLYRLIRKKKLSKKEMKKYSVLVDSLKNSNVILDLSGIEFIGNISLRKRYLDFIAIISMQVLAEKNKKLYLKYTKSYGPFPDKDKLYKFLVKRQLNKLPFLFVRGKNNLDELKKLNLDIPLYSFPDISLSLEAESKDWALNFVDKLGVDISKKIVGLSPSAVIAGIKTKDNLASCGDSHIRLCKEVIKFYQSLNQQILLLPHSIFDGKNLRSCDLALAKKIYDEIADKKGVFLFEYMDLTYKQARAIIGLLDFYVTGRYHSMSSALFMGVPTVALSWHVKYKDIISLFSEDLPIINCKTNSVAKSIELIKERYYNRQWFNREFMLKRKKEIIEKIDESIDVLTNEIKRSVG